MYLLSYEYNSPKRIKESIFDVHRYFDDYMLRNTDTVLLPVRARIATASIGYQDVKICNFGVVYNAWTACKRYAKRLILYFFCGTGLMSLYS